jgi:hypothetical protein
MNSPNDLPPVVDNSVDLDFYAGHDVADDIVFDDAAPKAAVKPDDTVVKKDDAAVEVDPLKVLTGSDTKPVADPAEMATDEELAKIKDPEFKTEDSKSGWANLKKLAAERYSLISEKEKALAELQTKIASYEQGEVSQITAEKIKTLETQLAEAQARATAYDYRASAEFQQKFEIPSKRLETDILTVLKEFEVEAEGFDPAVFRTMNLKQASTKIRELAGRDEALTSELMRRASELRNIYRESESALANAGEMFKQSRDETLTRLRSTFEEVGKSYEGQFKPIDITPDLPDDAKKFAADYNVALKAVRTQAEKFALGAGTPKDAAQVAFEAAQYRFMMAYGLKRIGQHFGSHVARVERQLAEAKQRLAELGQVDHKPAAAGGTGALDTLTTPSNDHESDANLIDFGR